MTEVLFYHLTESKLEDALPPLLDKSVERGWRVAVQLKDAARRDLLDQHLWTFREDSFLPHGTDEGDLAANQPVLLTHPEAIMPTPRRCGLSSMAPSRRRSDPMQRIVFMFDGYDQEQARGALVRSGRS